MQMADEADSWESWDHDLEILSNIAASRAAKTLLMQPKSSFREQQERLGAVSGDVVSPAGHALSKVLLEDGVFDLFPAVRAQYLRRSTQDGPIDRITISTAVPLTEDETREILRELQQPDRKLIPRFEETPEILGGMVVQQGDWRRDLSVLAKLGTLEAVLQ